MNLYPKTLTTIGLATLLLSAGAVFAETTSGSGGSEGHSLPQGRPPVHMGSTTVRVQMGSTTPKMMQEKPEGRKGIPGIVSALTANGFTMTARGLGKDTASTTITVVVTATTQYHVAMMGGDNDHKMPMNGMYGSQGSSTPGGQQGMGSSTGMMGSISSIAVGAKVEVVGRVATSTKTITAERINVNGGMGQGMKGPKSDTIASGTQQLPPKAKGVLEKLKNLLLGGSSQSDGSGNGASGEWGIMNALLSIFGLN